MGWDRYALFRAGTITILCVSAVHLVIAVLLVLYPSAVAATSTLAVRGAIHTFDGMEPQPVALSLLVSALLAAWGALCSHGWARVFLFVPQQIVLGFMAGGGLAAAVLGHYLDGTVMAWPHILVDQSAWLSLFGAHAWAVVRRCWERQ